MEYAQNTTGLIPVLYSQLVAHVERHGLKRLAKGTGLIVLAGFLSAALIDGPTVMTAAARLLDWHNAAIAKVLVVFGLTFGYRPIKRRVITFIASFFEGGETEEGECIEAIPTAELADHLFTDGTFKRDDIEAKFQVPRYRVTELTKHLKRVGVLTTGENNMSVLNPEYSRQDVASILAGKSEAKELEPLFRKREHYFTSEPSAREIADRSPLQKAPLFVSRTLALSA